MDNHTQSPTASTQQQPRRTKKHTVLIATVLLFVLVGLSVSGYTWHRHGTDKLNAKVEKLATDLETEKNKNTKPMGTDASGETFTYSPRLGDLRATLAKEYGIVVKGDGSMGGAPGAQFDIVKVEKSNIFRAETYSSLTVHIDDSYSDNLDLSAKTQISIRQDEDKYYYDFRTSDVTLAGLQAKHITYTYDHGVTFENEMYVVGAGEFLYTIVISNKSDATDKMVAELTKNLIIKPATLESDT